MVLKPLGIGSYNQVLSGRKCAAVFRNYPGYRTPVAKLPALQIIPARTRIVQFSILGYAPAVVIEIFVDHHTTKFGIIVQYDTDACLCQSLPVVIADAGEQKV